MTTEQMLTAGAKALEVRVRYASPLIAPIKAGQYVGTLEIHAGLKACSNDSVGCSVRCR